MQAVLNAAAAQRHIKQDDPQTASEPPVRYPVLLPTACVMLSVGGRLCGPFRALCDTGSQINAITTECVQKLSLPTAPRNLQLLGVNSQPQNLTHETYADLLPNIQGASPMPLRMICVPTLVKFLPTMNVQKPVFDNEINNSLADPDFDKPGPIHLLLGAEIWAQAVTGNIIQHTSGLALHNSSLGWLVLGSGTPTAQEHSFMIIEEENTLSSLLQRFWEIEEVHLANTRSAAQQNCEDIFVNQHHRDTDGRYVVRLPLKAEAAELGSSRELALKRFLQLERRFKRDPELRSKYVAFMREYAQMGHMRRAQGPPKGLAYYIPHHCVTKKFRVVFDASAITSNGKSLNDVQIVGEKLQDDFPEIILKFRTHQFAVTADIVKMFRQVPLNEMDWDWQRIIWREDETQPLQDYWLTTVTYGTASAAHNAVRALHQCGKDYEQQYPMAAEAILQHFYMDDCLTGANTVSTAIERCGFELAKWKSNSKQLLDTITVSNGGMEELDISGADDTTILGLRWLPSTDELAIRVQQAQQTKARTKRAIFSEIARLYDPSGYVSPVTTLAKILMQDSWRIGIGWDEPLPNNILERWQAIHDQLQALAEIRIPRWVGTTNDCNSQLHGFADASSVAYGAVLYLRVINATGKITSTLLCSKTRVAPVKTISIPRLELSAAELLGRLATNVAKVLALPPTQCHFWSDSAVTLHWIKKLPCELKTFVANRVASIQSNTAHATWRHVPTEQNPADFASRGLQPKELAANTMWFGGLPWLQEHEKNWPNSMPELTSTSKLTAAEEVKKEPLAYAAVWTLEVETLTGEKNANGKEITKPKELPQRTSTLRRLQRVTAYVLRFIRNARKSQAANR